MDYAIIRNNKTYTFFVNGLNAENGVIITDNNGVFIKYRLDSVETKLGMRKVIVRYQKQIKDNAGQIYNRLPVVFDAAMQAPFDYLVNPSRTGEEQTLMALNGLMIYLEKWFPFSPDGNLIEGGQNF